MRCFPLPIATHVICHFNLLTELYLGKPSMFSSMEGFSFLSEPEYDIKCVVLLLRLLDCLTHSEVNAIEKASHTVNCMSLLK